MDPAAWRFAYYLAVLFTAVPLVDMVVGLVPFLMELLQLPVPMFQSQWHATTLWCCSWCCASFPVTSRWHEQFRAMMNISILFCMATRVAAERRCHPCVGAWMLCYGVLLLPLLKLRVVFPLRHSDQNAISLPRLSTTRSLGAEIWRSGHQDVGGWGGGGCQHAGHAGGRECPLHLGAHS